jgi:hypothetical protein
MKDNKTALFAISFILIGGLLASPSMQLSGLAFAQEDTDEEQTEMESTTDGVDETTDYQETDAEEMSYEDHRKMADSYCQMSEEERREFLANHDDMRDNKAKIDEYCKIDESKREQYIRDQMKQMRDKMHDKVDYMKDSFERYCQMSDAERDEFLAMHNKMTDEKRDQYDRYCSMTDEEKKQFKKEHQDMMKDNKKDHMMDKMRPDSVRDFDMKIAAMCDMSEERKRMMMQKYEFLQEHHERIAEYCNMTEQEREDYRMTHQEMIEDFREDMAQMHDKMTDRPDMKMMIHDKLRDYDISDERRDAIHEKFRMVHLDMTDVQRDEISEKIKSKYMENIKSKMAMKRDAMSDLQKDQILKRLAEMRDYKADLRQKYKDMSEDERIQFQADFRDKVSDKRFSWISPHKQMKAGVAVDELECREGLNLLLKTSNGKALCVKSTSAERMIEKGLAVPAV